MSLQPTPEGHQRAVRNLPDRALGASESDANLDPGHPLQKVPGDDLALSIGQSFDGGAKELVALTQERIPIQAIIIRSTRHRSLGCQEFGLGDTPQSAEGIEPTVAQDADQDSEQFIVRYFRALLHNLKGTEHNLLNEIRPIAAVGENPEGYAAGRPLEDHPEAFESASRVIRRGLRAR
jgi:hypothetical protein